MKGPLLIASNHPNSFLDAIIYDILFKVPVWSLTRGDVFKKNWAKKILHYLKMMPVYRIREGAENLNANYETFDNCMRIFKEGGAVLIFSEGLCKNEWHLRPLKKGTARLALQAWEEGVPLTVLPSGINYSSFRRFGKRIHIHFGDIILQQNLNLAATDGTKYNNFNALLKSSLQHCVYEIDKSDTATLLSKFNISENYLRKAMLAVPTLVCIITHLPLYAFARILVKLICNNNEHYDSLMFSVPLLCYPFYLGLLTAVAYWLLGPMIALATIISMPLSVICFVKYTVRKDSTFK